ncbi:MAG: FecR domain-containing protein [Planctomycetes bacterium]|nr:FecR domain-containing protein [Planctomycetota bacterium]
MNASSPSDELDRLLSRMTEARLSPEESRKLAGLIEANSGWRQRYLDYCQMHAILLSEQGLLASTVEPSRDDLDQVGSHGRRAIWLALAAVLMIACLPLLGFRPGGSPIPTRGAEVAFLSHAVGVRFEYGAAGESKTTTGTVIPAGEYFLKGGIAELTYESEVKVTIEAPASFLLVDQETIELFGGKLSAHVPEDGIGFTIETPRAAVVDLGTDFGVEVMNQDAEVHVFTGEVRIDFRSDVGPNPTPLRLVTGEATRINRLTGLPAGINLDRQRFWRGFQTHAMHPYVQRVLELRPSAYYPMEPTEDGTKVEDISGNQATATVFLGRALRPIWTAGRFGAALDFGGPAQLTYAAAKWYPQTKSDQLSVVAWVHARSRPRWASIAKNWAGGDNNRGQFHFGLYQDDGDLEVHIEDDSGEEVIVREGVPLPLDQWHMVAFVADGSYLRLFRNGQQVAAQPYHVLRSNPQIRALGIGTKLNLRGDAPEEHDFNMWDGRLDELAIFNHALSKEEIQELFDLAQHSD